MQCPMEALQGRPSVLHNVLAGGTLGYLGVERGFIGVPMYGALMSVRAIARTPPALVGFAVYGGLCGLLGSLGGKTL